MAVAVMLKTLKQTAWGQALLTEADQMGAGKSTYLGTFHAKLDSRLWPWA